MKLNYLLGAVAASALMTGAAYAQTGASTQPGTNATTDQSVPSQSTSATTDTTVNGTATNDTTVGAGAASTGVSATSATTYAQGASVTTTTTTNGPVPDTAENRAKYGQPMSHAGKRTAAKGN